MSNQPENTFKNTKSSNVGLKEIQKKVTDHFADFDDGE